MDFVLGFQKQLLLPALTGADGFVDQAGILQLSGTDFLFGNLLALTDTHGNADSKADQANDDGNNNRRNHKCAAHLLLNFLASKGWRLYPYMKFVHENIPGITRKIIKAKRQHRA